MQNQNQTTPNNQPSLAPKPAPSNSAGATPQRVVPDTVAQDTFVRKISEKIKDSENILVALSKDPTVDEMAAAIGLTLFLDGMQKHATAIYSGKTPDALQFLRPEATFESNTDSLRDFIIALNKEKADHLRYKLDGDYVKVYITPYKTVIHESDLEFSQGDYNVSLVLALGVPTAEDLDGALSEYGRIMHDAVTVDIAIDDFGKFAEIEWSDPSASSVSELVLRLIENINGKESNISKDIATALLTGIVASTDRFSNNRTNSDTMQIAAKLMSMGADQQLISAHIMDGNSTTQIITKDKEKPANDGNLLVGADYEQKSIIDDGKTEESALPGLGDTAAAKPKVGGRAAINAAANAALRDAVSAATNNAAAAGASGVGMVEAGRNLNKAGEQKAGNGERPDAPVLKPSASAPGPSAVHTSAYVGGNQPSGHLETSGGPNITPPAAEALKPKNYAEMLEQALAEPIPGEEMTIPGAMPNPGVVPPEAVPVAEPAVMAVPGMSAGTVSGVPAGAMSTGTAPVPGVVEGAASVSPITNPVVETPAANPATPIPEPGANEPVLNPDGIVLPPPPDPNIGNSVMPPTMPGVANGAALDPNLATAQIQEGIIEQPPVAPSAVTAPAASTAAQTTPAPAQAPVAEPGAFQIPNVPAGA